MVRTLIGSLSYKITLLTGLIVLQNAKLEVFTSLKCPKRRQRNLIKKWSKSIFNRKKSSNHSMTN